MDWHRAAGGGVVGAALALAAATCAVAQSPVPDFSFLESSWCTTKSVNYPYCLLNPASQNGRFFMCRMVQGRQIGQGSGTVQARETGYLGLPGSERGRVVWFACESSGIPALTAANPPEGRCQ